ncbi:MAG: glycoside hydrolase family 9 protein [Armatimonadota bacterium]
MQFRTRILNYWVLCLLFNMGVLTLSAQTVAAPAATPAVESVCLVAPDVIAITIHDGTVSLAKQTTYTPQPDDKIDKQGLARWLSRKGQFVGAIAGKKGDVLMPFDTMVKPSLKDDVLQDNRSYTVSSTTDSTYRKPTSPTKVYRKTRPYNMARTNPWMFEAVLEHIVYLKMPSAVKAGHSYELQFRSLPLAKRSFMVDMNRLVSDAIHVTQIGFRPDDPVKIGFVSCWMGDGGGLGYCAGTPFRIVDQASGLTVYNGKLRLSKRATDLTEDAYKRNYNLTDVYQLDFSSYTRAGNYRVVIDGLGCSLPFKIAPDVWRAPFRTSVRGLYHQRSGIKLGPPYTSFVKQRDFHPDDGVKIQISTTAFIDTANGPLGNDAEPTNFGLLVKGATDELLPNAWGGYHDAGDWDRKVLHLISSRNLLDLVMMFPEFSQKLDLNIPESGCKLPDMLDEALYGLDVYRRLQTPEGGIRGGIESEEHPQYGDASWQESLRVFAYAPDAWSSYWYAGTAARAALAVGKYDRTLAEQYRGSALLAMEWAEKHQNDPPTAIGHVGAGKKWLLGLPLLGLIVLFLKYRRSAVKRRRWVYVLATLLLLATFLKGMGATAEPQYPVALHRQHLIRDARNYASAELFRLTGDDRWNKIFVATTQLNKPNPELLLWQKHDQSEAAWVYSQITRAGADQAVQARCKEAIVIAANERLTTTQLAAFRWSKYIWRPFGFGAPSTPDATTMIWAHQLTKDPKYITGMVRAAQFGAGANPMNMCMTTGVGLKYPKNPLQVDSRITGQPAPEGLTVGGPMDVTSVVFGDWARKLLKPYCYPDIETWPSVESYMDVFWNALLCEFTVHEVLSPNFYCWGYLAARK